MDKQEIAHTTQLQEIRRSRAVSLKYAYMLIKRMNLYAYSPLPNLLVVFQLPLKFFGEIKSNLS